MYWLTILSLLAVSCNAFQYSDKDPRGAEVRITKSGLKYAAGVGVKKLQSELKNIRVPGFAGRSGGAYFNVQNLLLQNIALKRHSVVPLNGHGLRLTVNDNTVRSSAHVKYGIQKGWVKINQAVNLRADASDVDLRLDVKIGVKNGKPFVTATSCSCHIGHISLHFSGGLGWVINLFKGLIASKIKTPISKVVCDEGKKIANKELQKFFATKFPVKIDIEKLATLDYSLLTTEVSHNFVDLQLRGEFKNNKNPQPNHDLLPVFSTSNEASKMAYIWLSDYTINSAGKAFYPEIKQRISPTQKFIPDAVKPFLNTLTLKDLIPALYEKYPDRPLQLLLEAYKAPTVSIQPGVLQFRLHARLAIEVLPISGVPAKVFFLILDVDADGKVLLAVNKDKLKVGGTIEKFTFTAKVGGSTIGSISLPVNDPTVSGMVQELIINQVNPILKKGFPLMFFSPSVDIIKGAIRVGTNIRFSG